MTTNNKAARLEGRWWIFPDGARVPYIAGGSDGGEDTATIEQLKEQLKQANAEAAARRHELRELQEQLKRFDGIDPDAIRKLQEQAAKAEEEKLKKAGEYEELLKRRQAEWEQRVKQMEERAQQWEQKYRQVAVEERLVAAFAKAGAVAPDEAAALTRALVDLDDDGVYVKGEDGNPLVTDGKRMDLEAFASQWLEQRPHHRKAGPQGAGSPGGARGQGGQTKITRSEFEQMAPDQKAAAIKGGAVVVDD